MKGAATIVERHVKETVYKYKVYVMSAADLAFGGSLQRKATEELDMSEREAKEFWKECGQRVCLTTLKGIRYWITAKMKGVFSSKWWLWWGANQR